MKTKNDLTKALRQFLQFSSMYVVALCLTTAVSFAQDHVGNGGSGSEVELASEQAVLEQTVNKITIFFLKNNDLNKHFPQVNAVKLFDMTRKVKIEVVNEQLIDRHNKIRTCLNFRESGLIQCNYFELEKTKNIPQTIFVLMFHELLGLLDIEETSPQDVNFIDGYSISKKLAPFVTKTSNYDLIYNAESTKRPSDEKEVQVITVKVCNYQEARNLLAIWYPSKSQLKEELESKVYGQCGMTNASTEITKTKLLRTRKMSTTDGWIKCKEGTFSVEFMCNR